MEIWALISAERERQGAKWGIEDHLDERWLAILIQQLGELAKEIVEYDFSPDIEKELVGVAAVAVAWLECCARRREIPG